MTSDTLLRDAIREGIEVLLSEQQEDGSFVSLSSENLLFKNAKTVHTTFFTSLIFSSLLQVTTSTEASECKKKAAVFLLSQKSKHWTWNYWVRNSKAAKQTPYPDDLDDTFCALTALFQYDKTLVDGSVLAKAVMVLTAVEKAEGGPYFTWLIEKNAPPVWKDVDTAVNSNIAYFLSLDDIVLPNIQSFIDQQISKKDFKSPYYVSLYPVIYFISRFYNGDKKESIKKLLLQRRDAKGTWGNPLQTALAVLSLLQLDTPPEQLAESIRCLQKTQKNGRWRAFPFVNERVKKDRIEFGGASSLTTAFCIEALWKYSRALKSASLNNEKGRKNEKGKAQMYNLIMRQVENRFAVFDTSLQQKVTALTDVIIKKDTSKQIPLLPYYFARSLGKEKQLKIPSSLLVELGTANVFGWIAYTIFDDFMDEDAEDPQVLSLATLSLRELTMLFSTILPKRTGFQTHFRSIMDEIDAANAWEVQHCRVKNKDTRLESIVIPNFGDNKIIAEKSLGHALGPLAILYSLGYKADSFVVQHLLSFFTHFLIAKQLNDDAHDWENDLQKGQINPVGARILKNWKKNHKGESRRTVVSLLPKLKEHFWYYTIEEVCEVIFAHLSHAKKNLHAMSLIGDITMFENFLAPIDQATKKALIERENMLKFLKTFKQP